MLFTPDSRCELLEKRSGDLSQPTSISCSLNHGKEVSLHGDAQECHGNVFVIPFEFIRCSQTTFGLEMRGTDNLRIFVAQLLEDPVGLSRVDMVCFTTVQLARAG